MHGKGEGGRDKVYDEGEGGRDEVERSASLVLLLPSVTSALAQLRAHKITASSIVAIIFSLSRCLVVSLVLVGLVEEGAHSKSAKSAKSAKGDLAWLSL